MTEEAPAPQVQGAQLDDDLINYEVDDFDATTGTAGAATDLATSKMTIAQTSENIHEIDWEDHDKVGGDSVEINGEQELGGLDAGASLGTADANGASLFDVDINGSAAGDDAFNDLDVNLGESTNANNNGETGGQEVEHEIDYDEDDVNVAAAAPKQAEEDLIDYESFPDDAVDQVEADGEAEAQDPEDEGDVVQAQDEHDVNVASVGNQSEDQSDEEEGSPVDDDECPDIAVTYHNEEFPLFHGQTGFDGQDGFFHDQSILDITMDQLLRKFRHELTSDIGPQDEIVLQVDEMGLEYAESTAKDHCISVTLRQIHEIFEQLSKNQDPDATRTLYTNLIIRPHPAKRLDLLINEAFNGKGLDDVVYSFSHRDSRPAVGQEGDVEMYGGDSSEADDDGSGGQEEEADDGAQEDEDPTSNADIEEVEDLEDDADQEEYDENAGDDMVDIVDLDDDAAPVEDFGGPEDFDENENGLDTMSQPAGNLAADNGKDYNMPCRKNSTCYCSKCIAGWFGVNDSFCDSNRNIPDSDAYTQEYKANLGATSAFESTDFQADQAPGNDGDENAGLDLLDFPDDDAAAQEPDQADKGNTSATVTLNGDGDNEITYDDDGLNGTGNPAGSAAELGANGDEFQEIDWRDGPDDDAGVSLDTSIPSKRPHSEVEVDFNLDDENEVKRHRS